MLTSFSKYEANSIYTSTFSKETFFLHQGQMSFDREISY